MSEPPPYPPAPDPDLPPSAATPPPAPPDGGYGTPPLPSGGHGTPPGAPPPPAPPAYGMPGGPYAGRPPYDVMAALRYGWRGFTANAGTFLLLTVLAVVIPVAISIAADLPRLAGGEIDTRTDGSGFGMVAIGTGGILGFVIDLVSQAIAAFFYAALVRAALDVTEGRRAGLGTAFKRWDLLQVLILAIVTAVGSSVGMLLCVLPGFAFLFFTWFANYFIVGSGQKAIEALVSSFRFTVDHIGDLIVLCILSGVIVVVGACACGVGLLVAIPVTTVAAAYTFRVLQGQPVAAV